MATKVGVEHNDGEGEHVSRVRVCKGLGVCGEERLGKRLHEAVDLLRFSWEPEGLEVDAECRVDLVGTKVEGGGELV